MRIEGEMPDSCVSLPLLLDPRALGNMHHPVESFFFSPSAVIICGTLEEILSNSRISTFSYTGHSNGKFISVSVVKRAVS